MRPWIRTTFTFLALLCSGLGAGWIVGLSVSPVVSIVVTSVIALIVSVTSAITGLQNNNPGIAVNPLPNISISPFPVMFVVVGLAIGASVGVVARTNNWLGPQPATYINYIKQWQAADIKGIDELTIALRVFDTQFPTTKDGLALANATTIGALFDTPSDDCARMGDAKDSRLEAEMMTSGGPEFQKAVTECTKNTVCLRELVKKACSPKSK